MIDEIMIDKIMIDEISVSRAGLPHCACRTLD
jgi:hypothetical protein